MILQQPENGQDLLDGQGLVLLGLVHEQDQHGGGEDDADDHSDGVVGTHGDAQGGPQQAHALTGGHEVVAETADMMVAGMAVSHAFFFC